MTQEKAKDDCSPRSTSRSSSDASKSKEKKEKSFLSKVVIRRLPASMTEEQFLEQISPVPENDYLYFVKADLGLGQHAFSRAYINFINQDDIYIFKEKFDGYVFLDVKGNEYPAIVEYAPFQKTPKRRVRKQDPKSGTLEQDAEYIKFLESLEQPEEVTLPPLETYIEEIEAREKEMKANNGCLKVTTPLIDYLVQRKLEKLKLREQRREERKQREVEKKKLREEEKRRRRLDKERSKDSSKKEPGGKLDDTFEEPEANVVKVLKNPVREQDVTAKEVGSAKENKDGHSGSAKEASGYSRPSTIPRIPRGNKKEWEKQKTPSRVTKDFGASSKAKGEGAHRPSTTGLSLDAKAEEKRPQESRVKTVVDSKNVAVEKEKEKERPRERERVERDKDREEKDRQKDPRTERRIRNKDRPSIEIYRPGMRRMAKATQENEAVQRHSSTKTGHGSDDTKTAADGDSRSPGTPADDET
uniref:Putative nonsense-mediated decay protein upf3 n=1 Tax=Ornithodoros turicata TaxID=34597 RepID=A0A2R5LME3_9ACAR